MRILQVSSHYPPKHTGGAERCCYELASALAAMGHDVEVAAPVAPRQDGPIDVRSLPATRPRIAQKLLHDYISRPADAALHRIADKFRPDVIHIHNVYGIGSRLVRTASEIAPAVVTLHDHWPIDVVSPLYRGLHLEYPRRARLLAPWTKMHRAIHGSHLRRAHLVAPSRFLAQRVGKALGREIDVVPNGLARKPIATMGEPELLFVGRLVAEKGLPTVLPSAMEATGKAGWRVHILGDGPLRRALERRFPDAQFHGTTDPTPFYKRASVQIVPSVWPENAPYALLDGMSMGLAVVAARAGGIPEFVRHGESGLLHAPSDAQEFASLLIDVIRHEALRRSLGVSARESTAQYGWPLVADRYIVAYEAAAAFHQAAEDALWPGA